MGMSKLALIICITENHFIYYTFCKFNKINPEKKFNIQESILNNELFLHFDPDN
jgi:hypothetical protein